MAKIEFHGSKWTAIAAAVVDRSAQPPAGTLSPLIGVLAENRTNGLLRVQSRFLDTGARDRNVDFFGTKWEVRDVTAVHDANGDGVMTDPAWQVLGERTTDRLMRVQTRRVSNGAVDSNRDILNKKWEGFRLDTALDFNANNSQELLVAVKKRANDVRRIHVKDYATGGKVININP